MKGIVKEDHHTADGALYKGDQVTVQTIDQVGNFYRVETKLGKIFSVPQDKILLDKYSKDELKKLDNIINYHKYL